MRKLPAKKRLGQNFLVDSSFIQRIIELVSPESDEPIVEIGPGHGALTKPLASRFKKLIAVEFDRDLIKQLEKELNQFSQVKIIQGDFLKFDPQEYNLSRFVLIGNIPYNITSPVIEYCRKHRESISQVVLMVQRELGRRIAATEGGKDWAPLSILTQLHFEVKLHFDLPPTAFQPPPEVHSSVLTLTPRDWPEEYTPSAVERLVRASFRQRRKQIVNNLVPELIQSTEKAAELLQTLGVRRDCRAEQLSIDQFLKLTAMMQKSKLL